MAFQIVLIQLTFQCELLDCNWRVVGWTMYIEHQRANNKVNKGPQGAHLSDKYIRFFI